MSSQGESNKIHELGIVQLEYNKGLKSGANYFAYYNNNAAINTNAITTVLDLVKRQDFSIKVGQTSAFTDKGLSYVFVGGDNGSNNSVIYFVVATNGYSPRVLTKCIEEIETQYKLKGKQFNNNTLSIIYKKYDNPAEFDKLTKVQNQLQEVKDVMQQNIEVALMNTVTLQRIEEQSEILQQQAGIFKRTTKELKNKLWCKKMQINFIIGGIIFVILGIIVTVIAVMATQSSN